MDRSIVLGADVALLITAAPPTFHATTEPDEKNSMILTGTWSFDQIRLYLNLIETNNRTNFSNGVKKHPLPNRIRETPEALRYQ